MFDLYVEGKADIRRSVMGTRKYRMVVAAILTGVVLFSPLLCGMTCLGTSSEKSSGWMETAPATWDFVEVFVKSGLVGCGLLPVALEMGFDGWVESVEFGNLVWAGEEILRSVRTVKL